MPFSINTTQGRQILKLFGTVTVRHAQEVAAGLGEALEDGPPVEVETGQLEDIHTCILQLLCSLRKTAALSFDDPSKVFIGAVERCGLRRELLGAREDA